MKVHPAADVWPMLPEDELRALADDIAAHGLRQPLVVTPEGELLAGRNRLRACEMAGVEPESIYYDGDPYAFVLSENGHRGHYSTGQRAIATALVLEQQGKRVNGRWARGSVPADSGGSPNSTWSDAMKRAGLVLDEMPELAAQVVAGSLALDAAYQQANDRRKAKDDAARAVAEQFGRAVHLLGTFIEDEFMTHAVAVTGYLLRTYGASAVIGDLA